MAGMAPAIELIDSRIRDWDIRIGDTIADNASSAGFVLGPARVAPGDVDLRGIEARLARNGEQVAEGRSDAVLGNPVSAVAWLARKVAAFGVALEAGHVVLPGSVHRAVDARAVPTSEILELPAIAVLAQGRVPARQLGVGELHLALRRSADRRGLTEGEPHQRLFVAQEDQDGHRNPCRPM